MTVALAIYAAGVIVGLLLTDARWPARVGLALAWPLGPIAFPLLGAIAVAALIGWRLLL